MLGRDGAACFVVDPLGWLVERRGDAARDPGGFGRVTHVERDDLNGDTAWLAVAHVEGRDRLVVGAEVFHRDWRRIIVPVEELASSPGPSCCVRCGRTNFGPCVSRTCEDLQASWA